MNHWLDKFFEASELGPIVEASNHLAAREDRADVPRLLTALTDPWHRGRWGAVYALGFHRKDVRVIEPLIAVLRDKGETHYVRTQAAECLLQCGGRKAVQPLIECSTDECADVRCWCVFALGRLRERSPDGRRRLMPRRKIRRALEARIHDTGDPKQAILGWGVGLEAISQLANQDLAYLPTRMFRDTMTRVLADPIAHPDLWHWANTYADCPEFRKCLRAADKLVKAGIDRVLRDPLANRDLWHWAIPYNKKTRNLFDNAVQRLKKARLDPSEFGKRRNAAR